MRYGIKGYYSLADLPQRASIEDQAFSSGWWELDQIFKFYHGQFVVVTGVAGQGKSTFLLNVLVKMAREQGTAWFLYAPENESHLRHKLRKLWVGDEESFEDFLERKCFIQSSTPDEYDDEPHTLPWVLERARVAVERDKAEIVMIDPWNELDRAKPPEMLLTDYIGECLRLIKQFCRKFPVAVVMVAHPTKAVNEQGGRPPNLSDIEGSMNWFNKCDNGLVVIRDPERNTSKVVSAKVREIGAGKLGVCHFYVDPKTGIFTPQYGAAT